MANGGLVFIGVILECAWFVLFILILYKSHLVYLDRCEYYSFVYFPVKFGILIFAALWCVMSCSLSLEWWFIGLGTWGQTLSARIVIDGLCRPLSFLLLLRMLETKLHSLIRVPSTVPLVAAAAGNWENPDSEGSSRSSSVRRASAAALGASRSAPAIAVAVGDGSGSEPQIQPTPGTPFSPTEGVGIVATPAGSGDAATPPVSDGMVAPTVYRRNSSSLVRSNNIVGGGGGGEANTTNLPRVASQRLGIPGSDSMSGYDSEESEYSIDEVSRQRRHHHHVATIVGATTAAAGSSHPPGGLLGIEGISQLWQQGSAAARAYFSGERDPPPLGDSGGDSAWLRVARWELVLQTRVVAVTIALNFLVYLSLLIADLSSTVTLRDCSLPIASQSSCLTLIAPNHVNVVPPRIFDAIGVLQDGFFIAAWSRVSIGHMDFTLHIVSRSTVANRVLWGFAVLGAVFAVRLFLIFDFARSGPPCGFFSFAKEVTDLGMVWFTTQYLSTASSYPPDSEIVRKVALIKQCLSAGWACVAKRARAFTGGTQSPHSNFQHTNWLSVAQPTMPSQEIEQNRAPGLDLNQTAGNT